MDPAQVFGEQSSASNQATGTPEAGFTPPAQAGTAQPAQDGNGESELTPEQVREALSHALTQNKELQGKLTDLETTGAGQAKILDQLKGVFNPESADPAADAKAQREQWLDNVLNTALESEKAGHGGMPITVQLAAQLVQMQDQYSKQQDVIDKLANQIKTREDPRYETENRAAMNLDTMVGQMVGNIYGEENPYMFKAITQNMLDDVQKLRQSDPAKWMEIARNPEHQKKVAQYYVEKFVPPKARELLHHQKVMETPMTLQELYKAYTECNETYKDRPEEGRRVKQQIREQILTQKYQQAMPGTMR